MKYKIILSIVLVSAWLNSQSSMTGAFGTVTIDGKVWNQIALRPVTPFWKFDIAWDLVFYFDHEGNVYDENWDFSNGVNAKNTLIDKIYYISYGRKSDPLYFKIGSLDRVDLGYGILVSGYSNAVQYPSIRNVGLDISVKNKFGSAQGFINDFKQNIGIIGGRFRFPKLIPVPVAVSIVLDRNQFLGLKDMDGDGRPDLVDHFPNNAHYWLDSDGDGLADNHAAEFDRDGDGLPDVYDLDVIHAFWDNLGDAVGQDFSNDAFYDSLPDQEATLLPEPLDVKTSSDPIGALAIDFGYPIVAQENMLITIYAQAAKMLGTTYHPGTGKSMDLGLGLVPFGIKSNFGPASFNLEYRMIPKGQFEFSYWNRAYDLERATFVTSSGVTEVVTKESKLGRYGKQKGYYAHLGIQIGSILKAGASYQNLLGKIWDDIEADYVESENKSFLVSLNLTKSISRLKYARLYYQQRNVPNPFDFEYTEGTIMGYQVGFEISSGLMLNYTFQRSFRDLDGDGDVDSPDETINLTTIETSFSL